MKKNSILIMAFIAFLASACVTTGRLPPGQVQKRDASFGVTPVPHWQQKSFRGADLYFEHDQKNASIFFKAQCENISDSPLDALLAQEIIGLEQVNIEKEERFIVADREALVAEMSATIDGVPRFLKIMVLKKNRCVFDAVFSAPLADRDLVRDFDRMIETFRAEAAL
ncbi:MAG TPA: hypothetical protein VEK06_00390 [Myxococcota bacterium]|nr:hypothetical protein [Myxococcota bacterium]